MYIQCRCGQEINTQSGSHVAVREVVRTQTDIEGSVQPPETGPTRL